MPETDTITDTDKLDTILNQQDEILERLSKLEKNVAGLLEGVQRFVMMADQMKGHPLFAAFAPPKKR